MATLHQLPKQPPNKKYLIIYHSRCWDGLAAAWAVRTGLVEGGLRCKIVTIPAAYGDAPPDVAGYDGVYIVDFSYSREALLAMRAQVDGNFVVLDHHKTAQDALQGLDFCTFDLNKSGARLAIEHFHTKAWEEVPWFIQTIEDRDLWRFELPDTRAVCAWLSSQPMTFATLEYLSTTGADEYDAIVAAGEAILQYQESVVETLASSATPVTLRDGTEVYSVNTNVLISEVGNAIAQKHGIGLVWYVDDKNQVKVSLRSSGTPDVAELAKTYGGGGHAGAAGFKLKTVAALHALIAEGRVVPDVEP